MPGTMQAMVMATQGEKLQLCQLARPEIQKHQLLIRVSTCGVCRTDLHVVDGELPSPKQNLIPGHQIIGYIEAVGETVPEQMPGKFSCGERVGVPWLGGSCGACEFCVSQRENLCGSAIYTGYQIDGGFAQYAVADARYCFTIPEQFSDLQAAPLLCAGLIGYRAYQLAKGTSIGLYGFGAAAHILTQVAVHQRKQVYAFTRAGDQQAQQFALELGAVWVGDSNANCPELLDSVIIFAPDGRLIPAALKMLKKGGIAICAGIHMSDIPSFSYDLLWGERSIVSVANLTRADGEQFFPLAAQIPIQTQVHAYALEDANKALDDLRCGRFTGAAVIKV